MLRGIVQYSLIALVAIFAYFFLDEFFVYIGEPIYVDSVYGKLRGRTVKVRGGRDVYSFTSIPYAKAPVGNLRFQPPEPYGKWEDEVLDATRPIKLCLQYDNLWKRVDGVEDCLHVHIYTTNLDKSKPLRPVMVWFHGGHFMYGGNNIYGPDYLLEEEDVVLVAVNYRLNSLGFLSTGDTIVPGNTGLKDQNLGLQWIKAAIKDFGGDPNSVTLFGCSAGGASVNYHVVSPMSKGLFHKAISQSGSSLCPWAFTRHPKRQARRLAERLNCDSKSSSELLKCLQDLPGEKIVESHQEIVDVFHEVDAIFGPTIEKIDGGAKVKGGVFLPDSPYKLYKSGQFSRVPFMAGVTSEEGCFRSCLILPFENKLAELNEKWTEITPRAFLLYKDDPVISEKIKKFYFGDKKLGPRSQKSDNQQNKDLIGWDDLAGVTNIYSDRYFVGCVRDAAKFHAKHAPTYLYYFTYKPHITYGNIMEMTPGKIPVQAEVIIGYAKYILNLYVLGWDVRDYGVCHTDEMQTLFRLSPLLYTAKDSTHYEFSRKMVKLWISFVKTGKPDAFNGVTWPVLAVDKKTNETALPLKYLQLGETTKVIDEPFTERLKFWEDLNLPQN